MQGNKEPDVLVVVPTMGSVHTTLASRLIGWGKMQKQISFYLPFKVSPVEMARNQAVDFFLHGVKGRHFTHLFFVDSDTIPEPDALQRLLAHDLPIVSGLTPIVSYDKDGFKWKTYDNCFLRVERGGDEPKTYFAKRHTGLQKIFRCGASCILIKREVFEKLDQPFYRFINNDAGTQHIVSEDVDFCDRATKAGFDIYADTEVICRHYKEVMV